MASTGTLAKIVLALTAVTTDLSSARLFRENHPLLEAPRDVDSVVLPNGGISKRLRRSATPRTQSYAELV